MPDLACLLIPQEIFTLKGHQGPQSPGITDARLLRLFPVKSHFFLKTMACAIFEQIFEIPGLDTKRIYLMRFPLSLFVTQCTAIT